MSWFENLKGDNFFAVLDVMIDIKNEIDILSDVIQIPIMRTKIRFPQLCPIDSPDMRDKYCNLRWKATKFLEKKGIIESYEILQDGLRWEAFMKIDLDRENFIKEYEKIKEKYQMKMEGKMNSKEIKEKRLLFLHSVYNLSNADENTDIQSYQLGQNLGFSDDFTSKVIRYLDKEGLIGFKEDSGCVIGISHKGIIEVERALSKPEESTEYFPPAINIIQIGEMKDSQIIQSSPDALQVKKNDKELIDKLKDLIEFAKKNLDKLELKKPEEQELQTEIQTIDIQLSSPKPKKNILKECVFSIRRIAEGATGKIIASLIIDKLGLIENLF